MLKDSSHSMESGFRISKTHQRGIFRSEIVALRTSGYPTSELQTKFYCAALGEARIANHEVSALA
jgi:phosphoenolpyruvate-protein kinase (PTS system EI component)